MITVEGVTRTYGSFTAVDDVSFTAEAGRVTGFLGPNGAGKSTTMRIMVGLTRPTSGTVTISGRHYVDLPNPGLEVGVLLDASAQHAGRTGREILTIAQKYMGLPRHRVEEMLELVSLTAEEASRRVRDYSLGMRQRLGIATALIGDPAVLVLDEPANGLDPAGIRWMRDLLRSYADRGGTVLLSSHLLHEIEVIADDIVMIGNGRIVSRGSKTELLHAAGTVVRAAGLGNLRRALGELGIASCLSEDGALHTDVDPALVGKVALEAGVALTELQIRGGRTRGHVPRADLHHPARRSRVMTAIAAGNTRRRSTVGRRAPLMRVTQVELRKMLDTRSGFWLIASIAISAVLATAGVILWAPDDQLTYSTFATAIRFPVVVILPLIAILAVTSEWSQRTGLTTFTLVPHRGRVITAKAISSVLIAVAAMVLTFAVGAVGNVLSAAVTGTGLVWDVTLTQSVYYVFGMVLSLMTGFMLGVLIRSSTGAIVAYFVLTFVLPTIFGLLATSQRWFHDLQPWVDIQFAQSGLFVFDQALTGEQWAQIAVTGVTWLLLPLMIRARVRDESRGQVAVLRGRTWQHRSTERKH